MAYFWKAGDVRREIMEVISPAGFENYFREFAALWPDRSKAGELRHKYELDMELDGVPELCARFGLKGAMPSGHPQSA